MPVSMPVCTVSCFRDQEAACQQCTPLACTAVISAAFWVVNPHLPCLQDMFHCAPTLQHVSQLECCLAEHSKLSSQLAAHAAILTALPLPADHV